MNKFNFILIIVSTLLVAQAASADYLVTETTPVYPGDTTYVYFVVNNTGFGQFLNDVSVRLEPKDNASAGAVTILNDVYSLGTIQNWGDQRTARFKIHVNPDAAEGDYFFNIFIYYRGQLLSGSTPTPIVTTELKDQVLTIKGNPVIVLLNSTLGIVAPMSVNNETLRFKNTGTGTVQNAVAEIDLTRGELKSSFSILGGGTQFSLGNLKPGDEADITFDMAVDISAAPGVYNIPITITSSNNYSSDNFAGLVVAGTTDFEMSYQETLGSFSINVANVGVNPASAVTVSLPNQKNFTIVGSSSSVLGSLNPGDYTSAIFQITKNPGAAGNILNVVIQYTDTSGIRHAIEKNLVVQLLSTGAQTGTRGSALYTTWLPVIVVIVLLILFWQRRKISAYLHKPGDNK